MGYRYFSIEMIESKTTRQLEMIAANFLFRKNDDYLLISCECVSFRFLIYRRSTARFNTFGGE